MVTCHEFVMMIADYQVRFEVKDGTILEGDPSDVAIICLEISTDGIEIDRMASGTIRISDILNAGINSKEISRIPQY